MDEKKNRKKMAITLTAIIIITAASAAKIGSFLPFIGKLDTPANANVSAYYISNAVEDTHAHNIVTAVLADYRGFDTLFETCVLFLSGVAAMTTLSTKKRLPRLHGRDLIEKNKKSLFGSAINDAAFRIVVPIILIYALYVLFHGEVGLGGGFQAGALLACAYLLDRIILTFDMRTRKVREETGLLIGAAGGLLYIMTGIITMIFGGTFLDYDYLPFNAENPAELHADGILMIEIGVTVCVAGVIIAILEVVLERTDFDD